MNRWQKEVQQSLLDSEAAAIKELEKQYAAALKDIDGKVKLFQADIDLLNQALSEDGLDDAARARLQSVKRSKVYQQRYQQALKGQVSSILDKMHSDNYATIDKYLNGCYETGFIGTLYDIAGQGIPIIVPIDQAAVIKAILTDSKVSNGLYNRLGVDVAKLKKTITQEISRGIASGLPYRDIARNIRNVSGAPLSRAKTIARTEGHRIQQTSTRDAQYAAKKRGADIVKQWDATLDGRTRDSHRMVDGEIRELNEEFSNGLMFPGDPSGSAAEVVNCRCTSDTRARWALDEDELQTLKERAEYFGLDKTKNFEEFREKYLDASKMAATSDSDNDWTRTVPRTISREERKELTQYAKERNVLIPELKQFDGDIAILKAEIDTLSKMCSEFPTGKKVVLTVSRSLSDADFASTVENHITLNAKALRDRTITESNILNGGLFASKTVEDIAVHEYGHMIVAAKGNKGLEIAQKAYYNVFGQTASIDDVLDFLDDNISSYSTTFDHKHNYTEVVSEILAKNNSVPDDFTEEFVKLLKGAYFNEKN